MLSLGAAHPFEQGFSSAIGACLSRESRRKHRDREPVHENGEPDPFPEGAPGYEERPVPSAGRAWELELLRPETGR